MAGAGGASSRFVLQRGGSDEDLSVGDVVGSRGAASVGLELTPNGGHLISMERGVHDAEIQTGIPAGVPAADG